MCLNCHWLIFVGCRQFSRFQTPSFSSLFGSGSCWLTGSCHVRSSHCGAHCDVPSQSSATTPRDECSRQDASRLSEPDLLVPSARECRLRRWHGWYSHLRLTHDLAGSLLTDQAMGPSGINQTINFICQHSMSYSRKYNTFKCVEQDGEALKCCNLCFKQNKN